MNRETEEWDTFTAYFCICPELQDPNRTSKQVPGGTPIGRVSDTCKGRYFMEKK